MTRLLTQFLALPLLVGVILLGPEAALANSEVTDSWGEVNRGLRLRAHVDSPIVRNGSINVRCEVLVVGDSTLGARRFTTTIAGITSLLRVFEPSDGRAWPVAREAAGPSAPEVDVALSGSVQTFPLGTVRFTLMYGSWPATDQLWGELQIFVPCVNDTDWCGVLVSAPIELAVAQPEVGLEEFSFRVPKEIALTPGPRLSIDSANVDTIRVQYHRGYHLVAATKSGSQECDDRLTPRDVGQAAEELPVLPCLIGGPPFGVGGLFIDGAATLTLACWLYEAESLPDMHLGISFNGYHRLLWHDSLQMALTKDQLLAMTPADDDRYDYRACTVPTRVRLDKDRKLTFRVYDVVAQEFAVNKGDESGYSVFLNDQNTGCNEGLPESPLLRLPKRPSCDSPVEVGLRIFAYPGGRISDPKNRLCGTSYTLWYSSCRFERDTGEIELTPAKDIDPCRSVSTKWRQCRVPDNLSMTADGEIGFDSTDMHLLDFKTWGNCSPVLQIAVDSQPPGYVSTQLCNPIARWQPTDPTDSTAEVTIKLLQTAPDLLPADPRGVLWSKSYTVRRPERQTPTGGGKAK